MRVRQFLAALALLMGALAARAADFPAPREASFVLKDFRLPKSAQFASVFFGFATGAGDQALYRQAPTREKAGYGTPGNAKWSSRQLGEFLGGLPRRAD